MIRRWPGLLSLLASAVAAAASGQVAPPVTAPGGIAPADTAAMPAAARSWQHEGSDIPADPAWRTGTLPNGLRYAVRRNARPAGTLAIRVRIDAGALMEGDGEQGWTHLIEHMVFRGTQHYADGEGVKIWQRLGASFGTDTNAFTSLTATNYVVDLPRADPASYRQAMAVLAEMMTSARMDQPLLSIERQVVLAEGALRMTPLARKQRNATDAVVLTGLKAARRDILGTPATLAAADAERLRAFYQRWYRPARAVVVVVGDADPALLEAGIKQAFGGWQAHGPAPAEPDFGSVKVPPVSVAIVSDPQASNADSLEWVRPHDERPFTIARVQQQNVQAIANAILGQRLATAAQAGGALVGARAGRSEHRHLADQEAVRIVARPGQAREALDQAFAVINELRTTPPQQAEVDQQIANARRAYGDRALTRQSALSAGLANEFVADVDNGDVTADPAFYRDLFEAQRPALTPAVVGRALADLFVTDPRMIRQTSATTPAMTSVPIVQAELAAARRVAAGKETQLRAVSLSELPPLGPPGRVVARSSIADLGILRVRYANGVTLAFKQTPFEKSTIRVYVKVGHGVLGRPVNDPGLFWSAGALAGGGIGPYTRDELTRLTAGRRIGFGIGAGEDGIRLATATSPSDLADALRLMTAGLTEMHYTENPVRALRDQFAAGYQALFAQPGSVIQAFASPYLHGDDQRFRAVPPPEEVAGLTLPAFRQFWTDQLAQGPIRIEVVGDVDPDRLIAAIAASFGTLPPRPDAEPSAAELAVTARRASRAPVVLHHRGDADQAVVLRVYPAPGAYQDLAASRALGVAAALVQTRLTEQFREQEAGTYSPSAGYTYSNDLPAYGAVVVGTQLRPERIADFDRAVDGYVADLARQGPSADALERAKATQVAALERARSSNGYWLSVLDDDLDDPVRVEAVRTAVSGRQAVTADDVKAVVARYLQSEASYTISALPEATAAAPVRSAARAGSRRR